MDSSAKIVFALQTAFKRNALETPTADSIQSIIGLSLSEAIFQLAPSLDSKQARSVENDYRREFALQPQREQLFPGTEKVLSICAEKNIVLAIATGKSSAALQRALRDTNTAEFFACIRTADDCDSKPSPQMLEEILCELDFDKDATLMIGDTTYDLQMAVNAGVSAIAACYGAHGRAELAKHKPVGFLECIADLPENLNVIRNST